MYEIDLQGRTPIYEQIYKKVIELILKKVLLPNDQLPSVRTLAKEIGINPNTVTKAFNRLENDGIIYSLAGRGSFVADIKTALIKEQALADVDKAVIEAINVGITLEEIIMRIKSRKEDNK